MLRPTTSLATALATTAGHLRALREIGITTVADLLHYFPRTHADLSNVRDPSVVQIGEVCTVAGEVMSLRSLRVRGGKMLITAQLVGREGALELVWFNQAWVTRALKNGDEIVATGRVRLNAGRHQMTPSSFEKVGGEMLHAGRLVPVYRQHGRLLTAKWLREKIFQILPAAEWLPDPLPPEMIARQQLLPLAAAVHAAHFPTEMAEWEAARRRLAFDELFFLQLAGLQKKLDWQRGAAGSGEALVLSEYDRAEFFARLPFAFTHAQTVAATEIANDLARDLPMNRLLEGDVGSGKTAVAALAIFTAVRAGRQAALLAPTEILAAQHFRGFLQLLHPLGVRAELLTGSTPASVKKELAAHLKSGQLDLVVGTHALLESKIQFQKLALAVIDEQHRFGVEQRLLLKKTGTPHVLALTATPIPRTLALTIFGDQDVSIIDELPPGRQPVLTKIVPEKKRADAYRWVENQVLKGQQVFVVCPRVEEDDAKLEMKAVKAEYARLAEEVFPNLRLGLLHGKLRPAEKDAVMADFAANKIQILVATTVIEVGIDVPNATIMLIEGADRFGLAQLHQLRGRVGRGSAASYCFLFSEAESEEVRTRLTALENTQNGFELAELDLSLRGPGEVFGLRQSGVPDFKMARLSDRALIRASRAEAESLLAADPQLAAHPQVAERLAAAADVAEARG